jgi:hypothetical protein
MIPQKENPRIPNKMGHVTRAGQGGCSRNSRVEVACQAGVCYYSTDLLEDKAAQLKMGDYNNLSDTNKKKMIKTIKKVYYAYLFLNNSNGKMHSQLKKDVADD